MARILYRLLLFLFHHPVMSDSLWPGPQHTWTPCPSPSPRICLSSCSLSWWYHPLISHLILWCPLLLRPSIFPSISDFSNELSIHFRWQNYWSFSFSISPSSEYSGLISFRIDWFDLLAVQETLKSLLQNHSLKALSLLYGPPLIPIHDYWKNHNFDYTDLVGKVMSVLFSMLSRFVIFLMSHKRAREVMKRNLTFDKYLLNA